ncbi:hypothetical protein ACHAQH_008050 [Verticillium albo-atrum]
MVGPSNVEAFIKALSDYYTLLASSGLFPPETIQHPPAEGWPLTTLSVPSNRSEAAIAVLRQIPYLKPYVAPNGQTSQWPILVKTLAVNYLAPLKEDHPSLPPDVILLARGRVDPFLRTDVADCKLDCATGEISLSDESSPGMEFFKARADNLRNQTVMPLPPVDDMPPELFSDPWGREEIARRALQGVQTKCGWTGTYNVLVWNRARFLREMGWFRRVRRKIEVSRVTREEMFDAEGDGDWENSEGMESHGSEGSSVSEGGAMKSDESESGDEMDVDVTGEVDELWADLDEPEFTHVSSQLAKDNISHTFTAPAEGHIQARMPIPPVPPPQSPTSIRDSLVEGLTRYYTLLTRAAYLPAEAVEYPPPGGWQPPVFPEEKLRALRYDDRVIDLLRHLPYIREEGNMQDGQWQVFDNGYQIRYLSDGYLLQQSAAQLEKKKLNKAGLSPYKAAMPGSMVAIVKARNESDKYWWLVDLEKGEMIADHGTTQIYDASHEKMPWLRNKAEPIAYFFDKLVHSLVTLNLVPVPDLGRLDGMFDDDVYGPEIWGGVAAKEVENVRGALDLEIELARDIYIAHGWPALEFRREDCIEALIQMRQEIWAHVQNEMKKLFDAECADDASEDEEGENDDNVDASMG